MTAFDEAWDVAKGFGDGFRFSRLDPQFTGVGELPTRVIQPATSFQRNPEWGRYHRIAENLPGQKSIANQAHTFDSGRGSGTGVGGAYYHGGDFDPRWEDSVIPFLSQDADEIGDHMVSMKVENPFVPFDEMNFFKLSRWLESLGKNPPEDGDYSRLKEYRGGFDRNASLYRNRTDELGRYQQPDISDLYGDLDRNQLDEEGYYGIWSGLGGLTTKPTSYKYHSSLLNQLRDSPYINRIMGERGEKPSYMSGLRRHPMTGKLISMRDSPRYQENQRIREKYNEPWWEDSNVLSQLMEDSNYYAVPKMNILLDSMGYDSVAPLRAEARGSTSGHRELTRGSVAMPPVEDEWWMNWHPSGDDGYQPLTNEDLKNLREGVARQLLNFGDHRVLSQHPEMRPGGSWRKILEEFDVEDDVRNQFNPKTSDLMWRHLQEQR